MNKFLGVILLFISCSCHSSERPAHLNTELPNQELIDDVISNVIKIDSLTYDQSIVRFLRPVKVYTVPYWPTDSTPLPPPPPNSFYYHHLLEFLNPDNQTERKNDSIYLSAQSSRQDTILIADSIYFKFKPRPYHIYEFNIPMFSFDKKRVYVEYWDNCGALCGLCYADVLEWTGSKWIRLEQYHCGIR